jgi:hypothetical protein
MIYDSLIRWNDMTYDSIVYYMLFFGIAWCCSLQALRDCMMCVQCLCWFKSIHRFMSISGFVKNRRVSGHMRWGIAFGPRCKSLPSGMCRYLLSNILNLDPGNLNPSANIYIYINMCVCVVSWQSTLGYLGPAHRPWWAVWFRWNPASCTSPLILHSPRVSA